MAERLALLKSFELYAHQATELEQAKNFQRKEKPVIVPYNRGRPPTKRLPDPRDLAARARAREENRKFREAALDTMLA